MSVITSSCSAAAGTILGRKALLAALDRVRAVVPARFSKPILTGIRLDASDGWLHLAATDGEIKLFTQVEAEGHLPPCVVSCAELVRRVKASKGDACTLALRARPPRLEHFQLIRGA